MKTILVYKDGAVAIFAATPGHDALELDLDGEHCKDIFSITVQTEDRTIFSAYHWHNKPQQIGKVTIY